MKRVTATVLLIGALSVGFASGGVSAAPLVFVSASSSGGMAIQSATAVCPVGDRVTGGGAQVPSSPGNDVFLQGSYPSLTGTAWTASAQSTRTSNWTVTAYAICRR